MCADSPKDVRIMKANHMLQGKVGTGDIDAKKVARSQKIIDEQSVDFVPMAEAYLEDFKKAIDAAAKTDGKNSKELIAKLTDPIMQIKANASMFNFRLVGNLANIMLNFLEAIDKVDKSVIEIAEAHYKTLNLLVTNKMSGDGGEYGTQLETELKDACRRYFAKMASNLDPDADAFFIDG